MLLTTSGFWRVGGDTEKDFGFIKEEAEGVAEKGDLGFEEWVLLGS